MTTATITVDVDVDLEDFDTEDLIEELQGRNAMPEHLDFEEIAHKIYLAHIEKNQPEYERLVAMLVYGIGGRIM